jgi:signal transduction histidine kinase
VQPPENAEPPRGEVLQDLVTTLRDQPPMVAYFDAELRNKFASNTYVAWFQAAEPGVVGTDIQFAGSPEDTEHGMPHVRAVLHGEEQDFDATTVDAAGSVRYSEGVYVPHSVDGKVQGFFAVVTDTTARVVAEAATRAAFEPLVLARERERIAADLHDTIIQSLYSASLQLAAVATTIEPGPAERVELAIDTIDKAIVALRKSIFHLTHGLTDAETATAITEIAGRAAMILGFNPTVVLSGPLDLPADMSGEVLAVITESLSNITKHAEASAVTVTVTVDPEQIDIKIADNGLGFNRLDRSSGLANLRARAEQLGGTFTWHSNEPTGTVIEWHAPLNQPPPPNPTD